MRVANNAVINNVPTSAQFFSLFPVAHYPTRSRRLRRVESCLVASTQWSTAFLCPLTKHNVDYIYFRLHLLNIGYQQTHKWIFNRILFLFFCPSLHRYQLNLRKLKRVNYIMHSCLLFHSIYCLQTCPYIVKATREIRNQAQRKLEWNIMR